LSTGLIESNSTVKTFTGNAIENGLFLVAAFFEAMNPVDSENSTWVPKSAEDKEKVRQQMNRLLETSHFKNSRRYPLLFRFIVEEALEGRGDLLKERLIGVRLFDRSPDYDTAEDPVVRVTIAEIRKRIAQYYYEEAHESEMRIELMPGRYVPEFRLGKGNGSHPDLAMEPPTPAAALRTAEPAVPSEPHLEAENGSEVGGKSRFPRRAKYAWGLMAALLIAATGGILWKQTHASALDEFWGPFFARTQPVLFCIPVDANRGSSIAADAGILVKDQPALLSGAATPARPATQAPPSSTFLAHEILGENLVFSDALAVLRISNYLATHNLQINLRPDRITTLDDLRERSVILVGGLDNQWTLRALAPLRYRFAGTHQEQYWIVDAKNPEMKEWGLDLNLPLSEVKRDFAIIARVHNESTGQVEMIVAGIGMSGTAAAGEFLVDPAQMDELRRRIGPEFQSRDFEAVLSTDVVNGIAGSPKILTVAIR
jgi:hypothetical protein